MVKSDWDIPQRYLRVKLDFALDKDMKELIKKESYEFDERIKISFNTSETVSGGVAELNATISGLTKETMGFLATKCSQWIKDKRFNRIKIDAGYYDKHGIVFSGNIVDAKPNLKQAEYNIQIKALSYYYDLLDNDIKIEMKGEWTVIDVIKEIKKKVPKLELKNYLKDEKEYSIKNYSKNINVVSHFRELSNYFGGLQIFMQQNMVYVVAKGEAINKIITISYKSNLIGSPEPNNVGCNINVLISSDLQTGQKIKIESQKFTTLNGGDNYILQTLSHSGDTKGKEWYSHLKLIKQNIYGKNLRLNELGY
jgi:hypothetical protein